MCCGKGCKGITLLKGTGIESITNNGDGTFTILLTNGDTHITDDFTGPQGIQGIQGIQGDPGTNGTNGLDGLDGTNIVFANLSTYSSGDADIVYTATTTDIANTNDAYYINFKTTCVFTSPGTLQVTKSGGSPGTSEILFTHTFDVAANTNGIFEIYLLKSGTNLIGNARFIGKPDIFVTYPIILTNFFGSATTDFIFKTNTAAGDSTIDDIIIQLIKAV